MITTDILIRANGKDEPFSSFLAHEELELPWNQLVEVGNQLQILLEYVEIQICKASSQTDGPPGKDVRHHGEKLVKRKRKSPRNTQLISQPLEDTARAIRAGGPLLSHWLNSEKRRKLQMQSIIATSFLEHVKKGTHNLKPILGAHTKEQARNRIDSILWLIYKHVSLAHALLVLYTFSSNNLGTFTFEDIIYLFGYLLRYRGLLCCEALDTEATHLISGCRPATLPPLSESEYALVDRSATENPSSISSKFLTQTGHTPAVEIENKTAGPFATKRKRNPSFSESDGFNNDSFGERDLTAVSIIAQSPACSSFKMQQLSPASSQALGLLAALGGVKVPRLLFERYFSPQLRWHDDGSVVSASFDPDSDIPLRDLYEPLPLAASLEELCSGSWICADHCDKTSQSTYSILAAGRESFTRLLQVKGPEYWSLLALQLACHVFPRDPTLEESFQRHGKALAPVIDHVSKQSKAYNLPESTKVALAEALIAKARLGKSCYHEQALDQAIELLGDEIPDHIQASIALRRSTIARLHGDYRKSEAVIIDYRKRARSHRLPNARLRSLIRLVLMSHLENLVQLEDYENAEKAIDDFKYWEPSNDIDNLNDWEPIGGAQWSSSSMELSVSFKKWSTVSKIYQAQGRLEHARSYLLQCYPSIRLERLRADPIRFQIICRLADLLCAEGDCTNARLIIDSEIQSVSNHSHGKFGKAVRRLKVSLVDVDIAEGKYGQASLDVEWLKQRFKETPPSDISDQWLHVRSLVASARLLHCQSRFEEAISEWGQVLLLLKRYPESFTPEGFFYGLCQLFISLARIQTAHLTKDNPSIASQSWHADTRNTFDKGCAVMVREDMNYWVPTLPTSVIPELLSNIESAEPTWTGKDDKDDVFLRLRQKYPRRSLSRL